MEKFEEIKQRIQEYNPREIILTSYNVLDNYKEKNFPVWSIFLLVKWTYLYSVPIAPFKQLTDDDYFSILNSISNLNNEYISSFFKQKKPERAFQILYHQQFYLQKKIYPQIFDTQLKLYETITGKYNIANSFQEKTGLSVAEFLSLLKAVWICINIDKLEKPGLEFRGYLETDRLDVMGKMFGEEKVLLFLKQLTLNPHDPLLAINTFKRSIKREDLQSVETTFFVMFPFQIVRGQVKVIHKSVINYTINHYIYDYLKSYDDNFTTEFGYRLEKYVGFGLKEMEVSYETESDLKSDLPDKSALVDYYLSDQNIFIECKASELSVLPSFNPSDDILFKSLKSSLLKAYFEQLIPVARTLNPDGENWGIIITYKEMFWSDFEELYELGRNEYSSSKDYHLIPPQNVFIVDIHTWDMIVQLIKDTKTTLLEILKNARDNNSKPETRKLLFGMHLDTYEIGTLRLDYLKEEHNRLEFLESSV